MSVLIKGMEMPESCSLCKLKTVVGPDKEKCLVSGVEFYSWDAGWGDEQRRHESCPLVPVPAHGRLINADEFDERIRQAGGMCEEELTEDFKDGVQTVLAMLKTQTTIIPAEEE